VLRLIAMTIRAGRRAGKPVAVCGELAGDHTATRLLLGMGLSQFSMHPASLLMVKREILLADVSQLAARVGRLLNSDDPAKVQAALHRLRMEPMPRRNAAPDAEPESAGVQDIG
jgi:phosphotransferase system enzyme I (PtsI)